MNSGAGLAEILARIPHRVEAGDLYLPCSAELADGSHVARLLLCNFGSWVRPVPPERACSFDEIVRIDACASRLPLDVARRVASAGETHMGGYIFILRFADGSVQTCRCGGVIDFVVYPPGKGPDDVIDVAPHSGWDQPAVEGPPYAVCKVPLALFPLRLLGDWPRFGGRAHETK